MSACTRPQIASLLIIAAVCASGRAAERERPNIVFILADDLGYGDLGCFGSAKLATPRIDRMAAEGMRFTRHYAGCTVCAPSRACLLSGRHTGHVYVRANTKLQSRPDPQDPCIAAAFRRAGYRTAMIGKSGLSCNSSDAKLPNEKGFDHFYGFISHGAAHRYYPKQLVRDGRWEKIPGNRGKEGSSYTGDLFIDDALAWLEENHERPFFLHLAPQQPHQDLTVPEKWKQPFLGKFHEKPLSKGHFLATPQPLATYAGMVAHLDACVGRLLDKLDALGVADNTLVLFASDNGSAAAANAWGSELKSSGGLRGSKRDLYEGGVRVPLIARWPHTIQPGRTTDHISAFWDFAPTACELAGLTPLPETDGISYAPTLLGRKSQDSHEYLYWEFYEQGGKQGVLRDNWKCVRLNALSPESAHFELFDLTSDPGEQRDVAAKHPEIVSQMAQIIRGSHVPTDQFFIRPPLEVRAAVPFESSR